MKTKNTLFLQIKLFVSVVFVLLFFGRHAHANEHLSKGESVYVTVYSNVYTGFKPRSHELSGMLSIRNTDPKHSISILKADYYDSKGKIVGHFLKQPL